MAPKYLTTPKKAAKKASAKKPSRAASFVTTPERATKKVSRVAAKPTKKKTDRSSKRDASKYVLMPDARKATKRQAKKEFAKPVVEHIIDIAVGTKSAAQTSQLAEVPYADAREVMSSPDAQRAVAAKRMTLAAECGITSQKIMTEFAAMGFSNMKNYGQLLMANSVATELAAMSDEQTAAIQELTTETYWDEAAAQEVKRVKIKLYPKGDALTKMAQHLGIKGFGGQLKGAGIDRTGVQTIVRPDGSVETKVIVEHLTDEAIEQMLLSDGDSEDTYSERTE